MSELLEMRGIEIQFPGVKALDKVDLPCAPARYTPCWVKTARANPVSYTHLDVYKRQGFSAMKRRFASADAKPFSYIYV